MPRGPKKRRRRIVQKPVFAVRGLLHLKASFVTPVSEEVVKTVNPNIYGYAPGEHQSQQSNAEEQGEAVFDPSAYGYGCEQAPQTLPGESGSSAGVSATLSNSDLGLLTEACEQVTTDQSAATSEIRPTEEETHVVYDKAPDVLKSNLDDIMAFYRAQRDRPIMGMGPNPYQTPIPALNRPGTEHEFYSQRSTSHTGTSEEPQSLLQVGLPQTSHYPPPTSYPNNQFSAPPQRGSGTHYQPPFSSAGEEYLDASDPNEFFIPAAFDRPPTVRVDVTSNAEGACANQNPTPATTGGQPAGVDTQNQAPPGPQIDLAAGMSILGQYWEYVKSNPHDFNGWSSLLAHVETLDNLDACRGVYNAFLPLYPYCYAYWKRYCDLERRHGNNERAMCILDRGLEAIPLSIHLWIAYLTFYRDMLKDDPDSEAKIRRQCERAIATAGLDFHSDPLWEFYIQWEADNNRLRFVTSLYRRLINTPTKLYNKHWENFLQHIRDHHPRSTLFCGEYEALKKESCEELKIPYEEEPAIPDNTPAGPPFEKSTPNSQPDEKLPSVIKEKLVAGVLEAHERTSKEVAKRWKMEDKIKRPYFHVKPLDQKQLKNWRAYLEFEEGEGDHERVVILYERALIACAHYEEFWCKYARYMENYASRSKNGEKKPPVDKGAPVVVGLSGEEEDAIKAEMAAAAQRAMAKARELLGGRPMEAKTEENDDPVIHKISTFELPDAKVDGVSSGLSSMKKTPLEAIREVYRRACIVHCPSKPLSRLQWAKFEEEEGNLDQSRELIEQVEAQYPSLMLAQVQRVNLERRLGNLAKAEELFEHYKGGETSKSAASWWAIKHARFCFKILGKPDKALAIIRKAMKRDKSNPSLFHAVLDVCYQRYPVDMKGFCAASDLALRNKELAPQHKLEFARKKMMFLREFGQLKALRRATEEYLELRRQVPVDPASHRALPVTRTVEVQTDSSAEGEKEVDKKEPKDKKFNAVPAPEEDYGFVTRHYSSYEDAKQVEYKKLTDKGYKDKRDDPSDEDEDEGEVVDEAALKGRKNRKKRKAAREVEEDGKSVIRTADGQLVPKYVLPPKLPKLKKRPAESSSGSSKKKKKKKSKDVESADEGQVDEPIPPQLNPPASDQNVLNIPDWFVKDGGELLISETSNGRSILRYWPRFFNDRGNLRMLKSLRSSVKWHQKRIRIAGQYKNQPRLVSWFGPCDYSYQGIVMEMDDNWPPELLDLLHRIISFTGTEYNSCFLNLYRSGNDSIAWHSDDHPALGRNPTIATVSLGAVRSMELVKKHGVTHMLRFPLLPGSLFVMEGSTQEDWLHQVPKDMDVQGERISLVFRVMYAMDGDGGEATQGALDSASPVSSPEGDENAAMGGPRGMPGGVPRPAMHLQMPPHMLPPPVSQQGPHPQQMRPPLMGLPPLGPGGMPVNQGPAMGHTLGPPPIQGAPPQMMNNAQPGAPPFFRNPPPMGPGDQGFMNTPPPGFPPIQLPQGTGGPIVVESLGAPPSTQSTIPLGLGATPISGGFGGAPPSSLRDQPGALPRFSPNIPPPRLLTFQRGLPAPTSIRHPPVSTSGPPPFHATGPSRSETPSHPHQNRSPLIGTAPNRPLLGDSPNMPSAPPRHPGMGSSHNV